jgi:hypothetical protein
MCFHLLGLDHIFGFGFQSSAIISQKFSKQNVSHTFIKILKTTGLIGLTPRATENHIDL